MKKQFVFSLLVLFAFCLLALPANAQRPTNPRGSTTPTTTAGTRSGETRQPATVRTGTSVTRSSTRPSNPSTQPGTNPNPRRETPSTSTPRPRNTNTNTNPNYCPPGGNNRTATNNNNDNRNRGNATSWGNTRRATNYGTSPGANTTVRTYPTNGGISNAPATRGKKAKKKDRFGGFDDVYRQD